MSASEIRQRYAEISYVEPISQSRPKLKKANRLAYVKYTSLLFLTGLPIALAMYFLKIF